MIPNSCNRKPHRWRKPQDVGLTPVNDLMPVETGGPVQRRSKAMQGSRTSGTACSRRQRRRTRTSFVPRTPQMKETRQALAAAGVREL